MTPPPIPPPVVPSLLRQEPDKRPPTFLPWWTLLLAAPLALVQAVAGFALAENPESTNASIGEGMGRALWGLVLAAAVAWVPWHFAGRPRRLAPILFLCVYGMTTLSSLGGLARSPRIAQAGAAGNATASVRAAQAKADTASQNWSGAGAFDLKDVKTAADLRQRVRLLDELLAALRGARQAADAAGQQLRRDLAAAGASPADQDKRAAEWAGGLKLDRDRQVWDGFEKVLVAGRKQLELLQSEWGRWRYDAAAEQVAFDDDKSTARFNRQGVEVSAAQSQLRQTLQRLNVPAPRR